MDKGTEIKPFETAQVRRIWHKGEWYYSIVDVIGVLTDSPIPRTYWSKLKRRAKTEGFDEALAQLESLKMASQDGRLRETDTANRQTLLRLIQSIPSPNAEPFRIWLAQVGEERLEELEDPALAVERMREFYRSKGYDEAWIEQRIKNAIVRNELTDEWKERGAKEGREYAILTNEISQGTFDLSIQAHKEYKLLPRKSNLRDHMSLVELALISLGEATSITFHQDRESRGFNELQRDAKDAGKVAGKAREAVEEGLGHGIVSRENFLPKPQEPDRQLSLFDNPAVEPEEPPEGA